MDISNKNLAQILDVNIQMGSGASVGTLINLRNAAMADTFCILKDPCGRVLGYVAWASLNKEAFANLRDRGAPPKYFYEWNEGRLILITEVLYKGPSRFALRKLISDLFINRRIIAFCRNKVVTTYCRENSNFRLVSKKRL